MFICETSLRVSDQPHSLTKRKKDQSEKMTSKARRHNQPSFFESTYWY